MSVRPSAKMRFVDELEKHPLECHLRSPMADGEDSLTRQFALHFAWMQLLTFSIRRTERGLQVHFTPGNQDERTHGIVSDLRLPCST